MNYDDPEFLEEDPCTCGNRALRPEEAVVYDIPKPKQGTVERMVFAKDCPVHGYSRLDSEEELAGKG